VKWTVNKLVMLFLALEGAVTLLHGQTATFSWSPSSDPTVTNYTAQWGTASGQYSASQSTGTNRSLTISNLAVGTTYYFAVAATDELGLQGPPSAEIQYTVPSTGGVIFNFSGMSATYNGQPQGAAVGVTPAATAFTVTYNGGTNLPVDAGVYTVVAQTTSGSAAATNTFVISPASATVTLSGLSAGYTGSPISVGVTTTPAGLSTTTTYNGSATAPSTAGSYTVVSSIDDPNYSGSAVGTLVISGGASAGSTPVVLGNLSQTFTGGPHAVTATTTPSGLPVSLTYDGNPTPPTNCGSYTVVGSVNSDGYSGSATNTLVVSPATAVVSLSGLTASYDGNAHAATVATSPGVSLWVLVINQTFGSDPSPGYAKSLTTVYTLDGVTVTNVTGENGILSLSGSSLSLISATFGSSHGSMDVTAQLANSIVGLPTVTTYNGSTTPPTAAGTYTVVSSIDSPNFTGSATGTLVITGGQTGAVTLFGLNQIYDGKPKAPGFVTVPAGLGVTLSYISGGVSSVTPPTGEGTYTVVGTITDTTYVGSVTNTFTIYDPAEALSLTWPAGISNPTLVASSDLKTWSPITDNIGPTNVLVEPKSLGNRFYQGPGLQVVNH
jgi:hypothetical protein